MNKTFDLRGSLRACAVSGVLASLVVACANTRSSLSSDGGLTDHGDTTTAPSEQSSGDSPTVAAEAGVEADTVVGHANDAAADGEAPVEAPDGGGEDGPAGDADTSHRAPPLGIDAGPLRDAAVVVADAETDTCDGEYDVPCYDGVPDRGDLGDLNVSTVPRPRCPETLPEAGSECSEPGLECGYGSRARADCRRIFECRSAVWHDESPPCYATPMGHCPESTPENGEDCEFILVGGSSLAVCEYGEAVTCTCGPRAFLDAVQGWVCNAPPSTPGCPAVAPNVGEGCDVQGTECAYGPLCQPAGGRWFCRAGEWEYAGMDEICYRN